MLLVLVDLEVLDVEEDVELVELDVEEVLVVVPDTVVLVEDDVLELVLLVELLLDVEVLGWSPAKY